MLPVRESLGALSVPAVPQLGLPLGPQEEDDADEPWRCVAAGAAAAREGPAEAGAEAGGGVEEGAAGPWAAAWEADEPTPSSPLLASPLPEGLPVCRVPERGLR